MGQKIVQTCSTCQGKKYLPLDNKVGQAFGNRDWLECPDCGGTGEFVMYERRVEPKRIFVMGG